MQNRMDYTERLHYAMRLAGLDPTRSEHVGQLAAELKVSYQAAKKALDGVTKMLAANNNVRAAHMLRVDSEWLATGEGEPRGALVWPLSRELMTACAAADHKSLMRAENAARIALDLPTLHAAVETQAAPRKQRSASA